LPATPIFSARGAWARRSGSIDNARNKVGPANIAALTNNTTGVAGSAVVDLVIPTSPFDATAAGGAQRAAFNTALGKVSDAGRVLVNALNVVRPLLGLDLLVQSFGTAAVANTLPAQDKTVATASGTAALDFATGVLAMKKVKDNHRRRVLAVNEVFAALGHPTIPVSALTGSFGGGLTMVDPGTPAAAATGASAVSKAVADAFLTAQANNLATVATKWNLLFDGSGFVSTYGLQVVAG
jgi:hypothetical protein